MSVRRALCALAAALALCALAGGAAADMILPAGLKEIAAEAFRGSGAISAITVPEGVQAIRAWAFADSGLTEITLPASLTFIDDSAF